MESDNTMLVSLLSGLIGSILGGAITYLTTKLSLQETVKNSLLLDEKKREKDSHEQIAIARKALKVETEENLNAIAQWKKARYNFRLSREAWVVYKSVIPSLPENLQKQLIAAYTAVGRYNTIIDYDVNINPGFGALDKQKEDRVGEVEEALNTLNLLF